MALQIYNTLHRRKEEFRPLREGHAGMYTCGPTVYDAPHIGNLRAFLSFDVVRRTLEHFGYRVKHVMNITDVDDKSIRGMAREGISLKEFTDRYTEAFFRGLDGIGAKRAHEYPRATDHIDLMLGLIERLREKGLAYEAEGNVYFPIRKHGEYGKLSGMTLEKLRHAARTNADEYEKEEARDFALWKGWTEEDGDVGWETPLGRGRPGWHIECSAMSMHYLGDTFDIHGGGVDLIFPHHENEIAQAEGATGSPFVRYWVHNEMILVEGEKMSKSKGNHTLLEDVEERGYEGRHLRYLYLQTHYRSPCNVTWQGLDQARAALKGLEDFRLRLREAPGAGETEGLREVVDRARKEFDRALADDFNTPRAMGALHTLVNEANRLGFRGGDREGLEGLLAEMDGVLGVLGEARKTDLTPEQSRLIARREAARREKDFALADEIRDRLRESGVEVRDTPGGMTWRRISGG